MERLHCHIRAMTDDDRRQVALLGEEVLRPLAAASGHPERYHTDELLELAERAEVYVALPDASQTEVAGFLVAESEDAEALTVHCICVAPAFEAQMVAHQLLEWAEGLAYERGAAVVRALVPAHDARSLHLYRGHNFAPAASGPEGDPRVMEKRLVDRE